MLLLEILSSVNGDADLGTSGDNGDGGIRGVNSDVTTLEGVLNGGVLELRKVLAGQSEDGGSVLGGQGGVVGSAGLVAISGTPDHAVRQSTEVCKSLNRLVSRTILTQTNGVVGGDPDNANLGQGGKTDGTGSVGNEVEESTTSGDDGTVGSETVHDGTHGVLTDTVAEIATAPLTNAESGGWKSTASFQRVLLDPVKSAEPERSSGTNLVDLLQDSLGELTRGNGSIGRLVGGEALLPALGQLSGRRRVRSASSVLYSQLVFLEELVPLLLLGGTSAACLWYRS